MARILLTTYGSYGDLHPFLAIGRVLQARGDRITLATHPDYQEPVSVKASGFVPMPPGLTDVGPEEMWVHRATHPITSTSFIVRELILPYLQASHDVIDRAAPGQDLIISHLLTFAAPVVAEARRIRWLSCALAPTMLLSATDPPGIGGLPFLPHVGRSSPAIVRGLYRLVEISTRGWFKPLRELRRSRGLDPGGSIRWCEASRRTEHWRSFRVRLRSHRRTGLPTRGRSGFRSSTHTMDPSSPARWSASLPRARHRSSLRWAVPVVRAVTDFFDIAYATVKQLGIRAVFVAGESRRVPESALTDPRVLVTGYEPVL